MWTEVHGNYFTFSNFIACQLSSSPFPSPPSHCLIHTPSLPLSLCLSLTYDCNSKERSEVSLTLIQLKPKMGRFVSNGVRCRTQAICVCWLALPKGKVRFSSWRGVVLKLGARQYWSKAPSLPKRLPVGVLSPWKIAFQRDLQKKDVPGL